MATYTVTTTDEQDAALLSDAQGSGFEDQQSYIQHIMSDQFDHFVKQARTRSVNAMIQAMQDGTLDATTIESMKAIAAPVIAATQLVKDTMTQAAKDSVKLK